MSCWPTQNCWSNSAPSLVATTVDTLKGARHVNMKELRVPWNGQVWRVAFAFDPARQAILLVGGEKSDANQRRFYQRLIRIAGARYAEHLATLKLPGKEPHHGKKT